MARAIAEGASGKADAEVQKIGEAFALTLLAEADGVVFGSPVYYADISNNMKDFLTHIETYMAAKKKNINHMPAAVFGSYGYDGAWIMEERLKEQIERLGYKVQDDVLVMIDSDIKYHFEDESAKCKLFGQRFVESL